MRPQPANVAPSKLILAHLKKNRTTDDISLIAADMSLSTDSSAIPPALRNPKDPKGQYIPPEPLHVCHVDPQNTCPSPRALEAPRREAVAAAVAADISARTKRGAAGVPGTPPEQLNAHVGTLLRELEFKINPDELEELQ